MALTKKEELERDFLLKLQSNHSRWFTIHECERLKELSNKRSKDQTSTKHQ